MQHSLLYAKSLSLLLEEVQSASDMTMVRSGLLRVRRFSRSQGLTLEISDNRVSIDGVKLQRTGPGLQRLLEAMVAHGVAQINVSAGAVPRELLKLVMELARIPGTGGDAPSIFDEMRDASLWCVQLYPVPRAILAAKSETYTADTALDAPGQIDERVKSLRQAISTAVQAKDIASLSAALATLALVEAGVEKKELRVIWTSAFDDAATEDALRMLVVALPECGESIGNVMAVLKRAGDVGAEVLIDRLLKADTMAVRRACLDALAEVRRGTAQLLTMLNHDRWFVVRNAAALLGEFVSRPSEPELTATLSHTDERVRAAVITALLQLDTPTSRATVRGAIRDESAEVRRRAVRGFLAEHGSAAGVDKLLQALERETELEVQLEFLYALGALASPDAVQKLIRLCSSDGRYRPPDFRIAAAEALASARLGASVPLLRAMLKDPDVHARAAARHLIRAVS